MIADYKKTLNDPDLWMDFHEENSEEMKHFITSLCNVIEKDNNRNGIYVNRATCIIEVKDYPQSYIHLIWVLEEVKPKYVQIDTLIKHYEMKGGQYDRQF